MEKNDDKQYPDGYEHVGKKVEAVQERVQQLDEQIKNVPQNSKPQPTLKPPGFTQRPYFDRERAIRNLEQQKADLKTGAFDQIEQSVRETDPKIARQVRDQAREELFPNPFRKMDVRERNTYHEKAKDIEQSQNYMDTMLSAPKNSPEKEKKVKVEKQPMSMSKQFSQGLSYTRANRTMDKSRDKDMDRE